MDGAVLVVVSSTDRRGAESAGAGLAHRLSARGWTARAVALAPGSTGGLDIDVLGSRRLAPTTLRALRRAARPVDVVVAFGSSAVPASALATSFGRTPFVYRNIGDPRVWQASPRRRMRSRLAIRQAAAVAALGAMAADALRDVAGDVPIHVIPNGASAAHFRPPLADERTRARAALGLPDGAHLVAYVGALTDEKRVGQLVAATASMADTHLVVAGDGPLRRELERDARRAGACAHFVGSVADPRTIYWAADVVALASRTEGLPAALVEAGLTGLPVVATDVGFVREVVDDGVTGVLVPADHGGALAPALDRAFAERAALGAAARRRCASSFDEDVLVTRWEDLLREVIDAGQRRRARARERER